MKISRRTLILGGVAGLQAQQTPTFSTDVKVVTLLATVRDKDGRVVTGLEKDDFVVQEQGVAQKILYFARETDLPLMIGLLVDTSRSQRGVLEQERRASFTFLDRVLRPDRDQAFVASFDVRVEITQSLTSSRDKLRSALGRLEIPSRFATLIFSAVQQCSETVMRKQQGRKAFVLLSDGVAFRDHTSIGTAIEFAQRADTIIYTIWFSDHIARYHPLKGPLTAGKERGKQALERLASETGGTAYDVEKGKSIEAIFAEIEEALRHQYSIGYTPAGSLGAGYRKVKVTTKNPRLTVHTRDGYYAN